MKLPAGFRHVRFVVLLVVCAMGLLPMESLAQSVNSILRGRVRDGSGGAIVGAAVAAKDTLRGIGYRTATDSLGIYQIALPVGTYEIEVSSNGFAPEKKSNVTLSVGQTLAEDFVLQVGGIRESVDVVAAQPLVETTTGTISALVNRERLDRLPLNGRDFGYLALLQPGVVPNNTGAVNTPFGGKWSNFLVNGQLDQNTLFLIDGSEINDLFSGRTPGGSNGLLLGLESAQEFRVLLSNYNAEYGRNSGGVIHVATRSGQNRLHGTAYEFLRNSALDAKNFFDPRSRPIPNFIRNQYGFSLGGPIRKDRTFFFVNFEGLREDKGITSVATVPSIRARQAAVAPAVAPYLNLYPLPNNGDDLSTDLLSSRNQPTSQDYGLARADHRLGESTNLVGRVSIQSGTSIIPYHGSAVPGFPDEVPHRNIYSTIGATSAIGSNAVSEFHFAFNRTHEDILLPPPPGGLTLTPFAGRGFGVLAVGGFSNLGNQVFAPFGVAQNVFEVSDTFSYRRGRHAMKFGGSVQRYQANEYRGTFFNGQYTFAGLQQFLSNTPASWLGVIAGTNIGATASPAGWRWTSFGAYAQDDYQATPNLTLNLGLRYEFSSSPIEVNGKSANLRSPSDAAATIGGQLFHTIARSFAPRFGFAWTPWGGTGTVLRGGFGIFYNPLVVNMYGNSRMVPPFVQQVLIALPTFPDPFAAGRTPVVSTTGQSIDYNLRQPYAEEWNLELQREFASNFVATVSYVGNRGLHLIRSVEANPALPSSIVGDAKFFAPGLTRQNTKFGPIRGRFSDGMGWYNALTLGVEKRLDKGWSLGASYTWSKSLGTSDSSFTDFPNQPSNSQDPADPFLDKGPSAFDVRHRVVYHFIYRLPFASANSRAQWLIGGWSVSGIGSFSSGYPFTVIDGFNQSRNLQTDNSIADRPNWNPSFQGKRILGDPARWFDRAAFELQPAGFYGNAGRNVLRGPGFANVDLSIGKSFRVTESQGLEFRADLFNLFNHPNFATPSSPAAPQVNGGVIVFNANGSFADTAGKIFRTVTDSRQIQFSLRYRF